MISGYFLGYHKKVISFPLGGRNADDAKVYDFGNWAKLGSGSLNGDGNVRTLNAHRDNANANNNGYGQRTAVSSVVVLANN